MNKLRLAYFGTPYFAADFMEQLLMDKELPITVNLVVTQPNKPVGRRHILTHSPVKETAQKNNLKIWDKPFNKENKQLLISEMKNETIDLAVLFAFGEILPKDLLEMPKLGFWNIHPSLLPKYRNVSPMAYALMMGDETTGVSIIQLDEQLDHGPILAQESYNILLTDKRSDLEKKLTNVAFQLFKKTLLNILQQQPKDIEEFKKLIAPIAKVQNHSQSTYTKLMKKEHGLIPLEVVKKAVNNSPLTDGELPTLIKQYSSQQPSANRKLLTANSNLMIYNYFRALYPWPGLWTIIHINGKEKRLKLIDMMIENNKLVLKKVQLEGKNEVDFKTFNEAYKVF